MSELGYVKFWYYRKWWTVRLTVTLPVLPTLKVQKQRDSNSKVIGQLWIWRPKNLTNRSRGLNHSQTFRVDSINFLGINCKVGNTETIPQSSYKWISCVIIFFFKIKNNFHSILSITIHFLLNQRLLFTSSIRRKFSCIPRKGTGCSHWKSSKVNCCFRIVMDHSWLSVGKTKMSLRGNRKPLKKCTIFNCLFIKFFKKKNPLPH